MTVDGIKLAYRYRATSSLQEKCDLLDEIIVWQRQCNEIMRKVQEITDEGTKMWKRDYGLEEISE